MKRPQADELLEAYRERRGPSHPQVEQLWARVGRSCSAPVRSLGSRREAYLPHRRTAVVTVVAAAAAACVGWWLAVQRVEREWDAQPSLAGDATAIHRGSGQAIHRSPSTAPTLEIGPAAEVVAPLSREVSSPVQGPSRELDSAVAKPKVSSTGTGAVRPATRAGEGTDTDTLTQEASAIGRARSVLTEGRVADALTLLDQYDASFPNGRLTEEAAAVRVVAECRLHPRRGPERARAFRQRFERSLFQTQVEHACSPAPRDLTPGGG